MNASKLAKAQKARELAKWFREETRGDEDTSFGSLMASAAVALECEAFRLDREGGMRHTACRPRLVNVHAA
jgi:hypothetical protein